MSCVIRMNSVTKEKKGRRILSSLSLQVEEAEIYGLLGSNGAGKTSVIRLLLNLWRPTEGEVEIFGRGLWNLPACTDGRSAWCGNILFSAERLTGRENLELHCAYMDNADSGNIRRTIALLGLKEMADVPVQAYSEGMRRRLDIARAVVTKPELLLLDEPFQKLDLKNRENLALFLRLLRERLGTSVLITAGSADDLNGLADRIGFLEAGAMVRELDAEAYAEWLAEQKKAVW